MLQMLFLEGSLHIYRYGKTRGFNISQYLGVSSFAVSTIVVCNVYIFRSLLCSHLFCLTRPKPAYGWQDLGQNTVLGWKMKNQPGTIKMNIKTDLEPWKTNLESWKTMKTHMEPRKTMKTDLEPWKTNLEP